MKDALLRGEKVNVVEIVGGGVKQDYIKPQSLGYINSPIKTQ